MTPEQQKQLTDLVEWKKSLETSSTIPLNIDQSFRERFTSDLTGTMTTSGKGATSDNQNVNEGGVAAYSVLKAPDAFIQVNLNGPIYYIPVFT